MKWILSFSLFFTALSDVRAWGPEGHMIVAEIAERQLTMTAKSGVNKLIPGSSLADVSTWADSIKDKSEWFHTKEWHFINLSDGQSYDSIDHVPGGDIITAIDDMILTLRSKTSSLKDKQNALKFLVHFVGDIHQPLHAGRHSDRGGNSVRVTFEGWNVSLHQLWDSTMITNQNLDYKQYAFFLESRSKFSQPATMVEFPYRDVINEDMAARKQIYAFNSGSNPAVIDKLYVSRNLETMNSRLLLGGKRLGAILNSIFR